MNYTGNNIYPIFDRLLQREAKEEMLRQKAGVYWLCGLSGSGKSTIAQHLESKLHREGILTMVLDGDNIRAGINKNLSFSPEDRAENIRRISEASRLFLDCGIVTINSFISPTKEMRDLAKEIIGEKDFHLVYINAPIETCETRDVKGLYKKARKGEIKGFTGIDAPFEEPIDAKLEIKTDENTVEESVNKLYHFMLPLIKR